MNVQHQHHMFVLYIEIFTKYLIIFAKMYLDEINLKSVESMDSRSVGPDNNDLRLAVDGKFPCGTRWLPLESGFPRTSRLCLHSASYECKTLAGSFS